jgi:hypothetical protein
VVMGRDTRRIVPRPLRGTPLRPALFRKSQLLSAR